MKPEANRYVGRHFPTGHRFGRCSPVALLQAMDKYLPPGASVRFTRPQIRPVRSFLSEHGRVISSRLWQQRWELLHTGPDGILRTLAVFLDEQSIQRVAATMSAVDAAGNCLIEVADGEDFVWLSDTLNETIRQRLEEAAIGYSRQNTP
jgi:hypothetical protein